MRSFPFSKRKRWTKQNPNQISLITTSKKKREKEMQTKIKKEKLIRAEVSSLKDWERKWTVGMKKGCKRGGGWVLRTWRSRSEWTLLFRLICRLFIKQLHRMGESVGYGCSGVCAGCRWQTGQNKAFFFCWLKKCNKRVGGMEGTDALTRHTHQATSDQSQRRQSS